jgi:hypothetical protein
MDDNNGNPNKIGFGTLENKDKIYRRQPEIVQAEASGWVPDTAGSNFANYGTGGQLQQLPAGGAFQVNQFGGSSYDPPSAAPNPAQSGLGQDWRNQAFDSLSADARNAAPSTFSPQGSSNYSQYPIAPGFQGASPQQQQFGGGAPAPNPMQQQMQAAGPQAQAMQQQMTGNPYLNPQQGISPTQQLVMQQLQQRDAQDQYMRMQQQAMMQNAQHQQMRSRIGHLVGTLAGAAFGGVGGAYGASQVQPRYNNAVAQMQGAIAQHPISQPNNIDLLNLFAAQDPSSPANQAALAQKFNESLTARSNADNQQHDNELADKTFAHTVTQDGLTQTNADRTFGLTKTTAGIDDKVKLAGISQAQDTLKLEYAKLRQAGDNAGAARVQANMQFLHTAANDILTRKAAEEARKADREDKMAEMVPAKMPGAQPTQKYVYNTPAVARVAPSNNGGIDLLNTLSTVNDLANTAGRFFGQRAPQQQQAAPQRPSNGPTQEQVAQWLRQRQTAQQ